MTTLLKFFRAIKKCWYLKLRIGNYKERIIILTNLLMKVTNVNNLLPYSWKVSRGECLAILLFPSAW